MSDSRTVLFDLDGTLTDSRPGILRSTRFALQRLNEEKGRTHPIPEEDAPRLTGLTLEELRSVTAA